MAELRESRAGVDGHGPVNAVADKRDAVYILPRTGFAGPVMETERFALSYSDGRSLM